MGTPWGRLGSGISGPGVKTIIEEVKEYNGLIEIIYEFTGNWWHSISGHPIAYRSQAPCLDKPTCTQMGSYGGMFARRRGKWAMAPETKFKKGRIATRD